MTTTSGGRWREILFVICALLCLSPLFPLPGSVMSVVEPGALILGTILALTIGNPFLSRTKRVSKTLLQASVVLLGFSMNIGQILAVGRSGLVFSLISISSVFLLGWILQRILGVRSITGLLVSAGTAICGGSAIAAVGTVVDAPAEDMSVAIGTVFLLNAIALLIFPPLGHLLGLSQHAFGIWAGIAIHDIASVVGAGTSYGPRALEVATAVKLSRVLYLIPIVFIIAWVQHRRTHTEGSGAQERRAMQIPWFIGFFLLASLCRSYVPVVAEYAGPIKQIAVAGFSLTLFLIGAGLTRSTLKAVGARPLIMGAILWVFISVAALGAVWLG